jgi:hypothetical protein
VSHESAILLILAFRELGGESLVRLDEVFRDPLWKAINKIAIAAAEDRKTLNKFSMRRLKIRRKLCRTGEQHASLDSRIVLVHGTVKPTAILHVATDLHTGMGYEVASVPYERLVRAGPIIACDPVFQFCDHSSRPAGSLS